MEKLKSILEIYTTFNGRISRIEYFKCLALYAIMYIILLIILGIAVAFLDIPEGSMGEFIFTNGIIMLFSMLMIPATIKRLHDTNRSGWFLLIGLIPLVNLYLAYVVYLEKGTSGSNQYGEDPLAKNS